MHASHIRAVQASAIPLPIQFPDDASGKADDGPNTWASVPSWVTKMEFPALVAVTNGRLY